MRPPRRECEERPGREDEAADRPELIGVETAEEGQGEEAFYYHGLPKGG